jgi:hypothetical protein
MKLLTTKDLENLLACITRAEHKTTGVVTQEEYESVVRLCQELETPQFITEYFARKAITSDE